MAVNCWVWPAAIDEFEGATVIETSAAVVTVRLVEPATNRYFALMLVAPWLAAVTRPLTEMAATDGFDEFQFANIVTSRMLPSLSVAVATNC